MNITPVDHLPTHNRPGRAPIHPWADVATACDAAPGIWHLVLENLASPSLGYLINSGNNKTLPNDTYEAAARSTVIDGKRRYKIYVRRNPIVNDDQS